MRRRKKRQKTEQNFIFYDAKGRRKIYLSGLILFIVISSTIVFYYFFQSILSSVNLPQIGYLLSQEKDILPINVKLSDHWLRKELKYEESKHHTAQMGYNKHHKNWGVDTNLSKEVYGFYVNWDENSTSSLKDNIRSLTMLVPEWYHLNSNLTFNSEVSPDIVQLAKLNDVKIMPLINNFTQENPDGVNIKQLLHSPPNIKTKFIHDLLKQIELNQFAGVNIDFEAVEEKDRDKLTAFIQELSTVFHQHHLQVTQDVPPDDQAFNYKVLSKAVDRMIVMMYDEHDRSSAPGPIASNKWFGDKLNNVDIPPSKLIVAFGNYGYDWVREGSEPAESLTFSEVMKLVHDSHLKIIWDDVSGNPYFRYKEGENDHIVWFLDGITLYNQMKISLENQAKGFAFWRLGSEDPTIWRSLEDPINIQTKTNKLREIASTDRVNYFGQGEILRITSAGQNGKREFKEDKNGYLADERYTAFPSAYQVQRFGQPKGKQVVLTFDDGPDPNYTPKVLDILNKYKLKANFFVVGENAELNSGIISRMYREGHEIGNHTFTHPNVADVSPFRTKMELNATQRLIQEITGHSMTLFRPPYVADAEPYLPSELLPILRAQDMNYTMVGEKIDPEDWAQPSTSDLIKRVLTPIYNGEGNVILLHDAGGDRSHTIEALPIIIQDLQRHGYTFVTVSHLLGKSRDDIMPPVKQNPFLIYDWAVFSGTEFGNYILSTLFYLAIGLGIFRFLFLIYFSSKQNRESKVKYESESTRFYQPFVSVVIAAFNEEKVINKTIQSVLGSYYPNFEVLIIDDGSTDNTSNKVRTAFHGIPKVRLIQKENGGKASAINRGFCEAGGEIVIALDADTIMDPNAISLLVRHFENAKIAAVSGNVKVGNRRKLLTVWQHIEYVTGFNLERRAFDQLNCITVVPGAIGAWRKQYVEVVGYFSESTLAEDTDLTLTLLQKGHRIAYEKDAYAYTESPEDVKSLLKQRYRWSYGTLQCLWKHRKALFNPQHRTLGFIALPNMWFFQYIFQTISPLADLLMAAGVFGSHPLKVLGFYLLFLFLDLLASLFAFRLEKESMKPLIWLFLQRFIYRQFMTYVVIKSIFSSIRGVSVGWNKLKRTGNVEQSL
jgi:peptidoglycan-N-acetylglucosamine deacetylase